MNKHEFHLKKRNKHRIIFIICLIISLLSILFGHYHQISKFVTGLSFWTFMISVFVCSNSLSSILRSKTDEYDKRNFAHLN